MNLEGCPYSLASMQLEDLPTVAAIEQTVFSLPWSATSFRYEITQNSSSEYVTLRYRPRLRTPAPESVGGLLRRLVGTRRQDASLLGYGGFWFLIDEAHITTLALRPEWRGRRLGELLLVSLIERALARGAMKVSLEVRISNVVAQSLYTKYGFQTVGQRRDYYSDNREDAYIMTVERIDLAEYQGRFEALCNDLRTSLLREGDLPLERPLPGEASANPQDSHA
jgi:ribosomal-protein-alanine N-acetyltransferase